MRLLFCCEFYHPSRGGVQEVMRQIAERMALAGHDITIATSHLPERKFTSYNGVAIRGFKVAGNSVRGMVGELDRYRKFVREFDGDAILIKAAQQWTFDALWPVLDQIKARKIFVPCGFSGFYEPAYERYFSELPQILAKFDHLIFYAEQYRDVDFARAHGFTDFSVLPNGASEVEFGVTPDPCIRARLGISDADFVFLTVGAPVALKGHREIAEAFALLDTGGKPATLILNANWPPFIANRPNLDIGQQQLAAYLPQIQDLRGLLRKLVGPNILLAQYAFQLFREEGWQGLAAGVRRRSRRLQFEKQQTMINGSSGQAESAQTVRGSTKNAENPQSIDGSIKNAELQPGKQILRTNLSRSDLVQAYLTADLFVFASNVEYSPLVLFEAAAAGTPFLSVPVGNAEEIARWTCGGMICPAAKDERGYTRADPSVLAREMERCMKDPDMLARIGAAGKESWRRMFTWQAIAPQYESILSGRASGTVPQESMGGKNLRAG